MVRYLSYSILMIVLMFYVGGLFHSFLTGCILALVIPLSIELAVRRHKRPSA
jgi:hypothetical protein